MRGYDATRFEFYSPEEVWALVRAAATEWDALGAATLDAYAAAQDWLSGIPQVILTGEGEAGSPCRRARYRGGSGLRRPVEQK